jgi:hypothetical protein
VSTAEDVRRGRPIEGMPGTFTRAFKPLPIVPKPLDANEWRQAQALGMAADTHRYGMGQATIFVDQEPAAADGSLLWHLSISLPHRHPTWDELKYVRYALLPDDRCFAVLLPPSHLYVNVPAQDHVFHLWEVTDPRQPWTAG